MNAIDLIKAFNQPGSALEVVDGQLKITAPKSLLTDDIKSALKVCKFELIKLVAANAPIGFVLQEPEYHYRADHLKPFEQEHYADTCWIMDIIRLAPQDRQHALLNEYSNIYQRSLTEVPGLKAVGHARRTANTFLRKEAQRQSTIYSR